MKRIFKIFLLALVPFVLLSCVNTRKFNTAYLYKNQVIYESKFDKNGNNIILRDRVLTPCLVKIKAKDSLVELVVLEGELKSDTLSKGQKANYSKGFFFPYLDTVSSFKKRFVESEKLRFLESNSIFQAITIPLKVRFAQGNLPNTASGSINVGFAWGWKFTHNVYKNYHHGKSKTYLNSKTSSFSLTPGIFAGPTVIEITSENSTFINDRDVLGITGGGMLVFGINRFNIGIASGLDYVVGNQNKSWVYNGKLWVGATIALDFIK